MTLAQASIQPTQPIPIQPAILGQSLRYFKGVGPRRLEQLAELGLATVEDALYYAPSRYEDRSHFADIRSLKAGMMATVRGKILARSMRRVRGGRSLTEAAIGDRTGILHAVWFNMPHLAQQLVIGRSIILYGRIELGRRPQIIHPEIEQADQADQAASEAPEATSSLHMGRIVPIYPLSSGIGQRYLRELMWSIVQAHASAAEDTLPERLRQTNDWLPLEASIRNLHFPSSWQALEAAKRRLSFEELLTLQLALAQRRAQTEAKLKPQRYRLDGPITQGLQKALPFKLTRSQQQVLDEMLADLGRSSPMHRLLQGDVGCGKTIVMIWLLAVAAQSGAQAAVMAPTELLAEQHVRLIQHLLGPLGVTATLLAQGVAPDQRLSREQDIAAGRINIVVGTHALLERRVQFKRLSLVVVDEQHKFGVLQRAHLAAKAQEPDVLIMTATPIPRTLALSLYGDLSVSTIAELPPGRSPIRTLWLHESQRDALYRLVQEQLTQGRQVYIVYPMVVEQAQSDLKAATQMAQRLQTGPFKHVKVGLLHGQMKPQQKEQAMTAFSQGKIQLLVSTVIVEVGLDVPNATVMVIEHPQRFGLAQLHQLRGRIGRGAHAATCVLVGEAADEDVRKRLEAFVATSDGFALAERDLEIRGPGELFGSRQHGTWWRFRIANLLRDSQLLEQARAEAQTIVSQDPALSTPEFSHLRYRVHRLRQEPKDPKKP